MSHVEFDSLWALSQGQLGAAEASQVRAHLASCSACAAQLASIEVARPMMASPPVPDLGAARWRAIDEKVFEAAARQMHRPSLLRALRSWWDAPLFKPALAAAALAAGVLVVALAGRQGLPPTQPVAVLPVEPAGEASVLTAVESTSGKAELLADEKVARGATIATRPHGEAWLKLPDGSKLGVLSSTSAKLEDLAPRSVRVSLEKGALAVAAVHEPERLLEVSAGRLSVRVVGTRFMVLRDDETSGVVVEEGMVEANVDGKTRMVPAGSSLTVTNQGMEVGSVEEPERRQMQQIVPPRPLARPKPAVEPAAAASPAPEVVAVVVPSVPAPEVPEADGVQEAEELSEVDEAWAELPRQPDSSAQALPVPPRVVGEGERSWVELQLDKISRAHCNRVFAKVDEMTTRWAPDSGVVMTKRRQRQLTKALEERERCFRRWGYPSPRP